MFSAEDVARVVRLLNEAGVRVWLSGGWGIDALLGEQTRPHKDIDIQVQVDDVTALFDLLAPLGYTLAYEWEENRPAVDSCGAEIPTAFVLRDAAGREVDVHTLRLDDEGNGIPAWECGGLVLPAQDLNAVGVIAGVPVVCFSPALQAACHSGYELPEAHRQDMQRLRARFGSLSPADDAG